MPKLYDFTDRVMTSLLGKIFDTFETSKAKFLTDFDEINTLKETRILYADLKHLCKTYYLKIAKYIYEEYAEEEKREIDMDWVVYALSMYDPVCKYIFMNEAERKRQYLFESLIAAGKDGRAAEIEKAIRLWVAMATQFADNITDTALIEAYKDNGVVKVKWVSQKDDKVCEECDNLDGQVFDIDDLPPKHRHCRCYIVPYKN